MAKATKKRPFLWVIIILLFVGLLGFGTGGLNGTILAIGTVGDKDITVTQYQNELQDQLRAFALQTETPIGFQQAQALGLDSAVIGQLVTERTLDNEVANLGLSVSDVHVRAQILTIPAFTGLNGSFDRAVYTDQLRRIGLSEAEFETSLREDISRSLLQRAVVAGLAAPTPYADALVQYVGETRDITFAPVTAADLTVPVPGPTDADIASYYETNGADFMRPEARDITYAWLTPAMIQDDLEVDETALRELYDDRIDQFVQPERRLVERLIFVDQDAADAAMAKLDADEAAFDDLVADRGLDLSDVDLGDVSAADLGDAGGDVFSAEVGDVVGPLDTSLGPALFRVNAVLAATEITFEDASADLREELATQRARRVIDGTIEGINDLIAGGATLEDLVDRTDLVLGQIALSDDTTDAIAAYDNFRDAALTAEVGDFPELLQLSDGGIFALRLNEVTAPTQIPLDEIRDDVAAAWTAELTQKMVVAHANGLAEDLNDETDFEALGLIATDADLLARNSFVEGTPPGFIQDVFAMDLNAVQVFDAGDRALIVKLDTIAPPAPDSEQTQASLAQIADGATGGIAQDIFEAFATTVQGRTEITLNQAAINAVNAQFQ